MIRFEQASKIYRTPNRPDVTALADFTLEIPTGTSVCLIGTSGSGKTTALKMINRLVDPTQGRVTLAGEDLQKLDPIALRRRLGYVVQSSGLFPHLTVHQNIGLLAKLEGWAKPRIDDRVAELLELVKLPVAHYGHRFPLELSGGQRQRVGIARALVLDPEGILLDEPFSALDPITRAQLRLEFLELRQRMAKTLVMVTHDMHDAFVLADQVVLMREGRAVQIGTPQQLRDHPNCDFAKEFVESQCFV